MIKVVKKLLEAGADVHTVELKDCANDVIAGMVKREIAERDKRAPLCSLTEEFQDEGGQIFRDATTLMKHIALKIDLHSRIGEIESSFIDKPCTVIWRDGVFRSGVT